MRRLEPTIAVVLVGLTLASARAQEPAGLSSRLRAAVLAASPTVLAPSRLPEGWKASRAEAVATGRETYRLVYHGPEGACFAIENGLTFDRVGEPTPPRWRAVEIAGAMGPAGGDPYHLFWATEDDVEFPGPVPVVRSDWITTHADAHRLISPVAVEGGCEAIDPDVAADVLASLVVLTVDDRPDRLVFSMVLYAPIPSPPERTIDAAAGESPEATARRVLAELGIPPEAGPAEGELAVDEQVAIHEDPNGGGTAVLVTRTGGGDDSVAGVRYLVWLAEIEPGVVQYRAGRQVRCHAGRGHRSWGAQPCL